MNGWEAVVEPFKNHVMLLDETHGVAIEHFELQLHGAIHTADRIRQPAENLLVATRLVLFALSKCTLDLFVCC